MLGQGVLGPFRAILEGRFLSGDGRNGMLVGRFSQIAFCVKRAAFCERGRRRQKAEGRRLKAEGRRQKVEGRRQKEAFILQDVVAEAPEFAIDAAAALLCWRRHVLGRGDHAHTFQGSL